MDRYSIALGKSPTNKRLTAQDFENFEINMNRIISCRCRNKNNYKDKACMDRAICESFSVKEIYD